MDNLENKFRGRIIPGEDGLLIKETKEEGLLLEETNIRMRLDTDKNLKAPDKERLEERLEQIARERRGDKNRPTSPRSSIVKP